MNRLRKLKNNKKVLVSLVVVMIVLLAVVLRTSFAVLTPVKSVTIYSEKTNYEEKEAGAWKVEKSAKWIDKGKARITFDLDTIVKTEYEYSDVILVLDISESMSGDKLNKVKEDASKLVEKLLSKDKNRIALITFETTSKIVDTFTNDKKKIINDINGLTEVGSTNYYQALVNVDTILKDYQKEDKRKAIVLFLTDGYPNEDIPNEVSQYNYLKSEYPYLTINGVQYEMGTDILDPIKKVTDSQYVADMNSLNNVLFDAAVAPLTYKTFTITDYIDDTYFKVKNINSIETSMGTAELTYEDATPKVSWTIEEGKLKSGEGATMTIDIELKDEYLNQGGVYPTNKREVITSIIDDNPNENVTSNKTPILADNYVVKYEGNAPDECEIEGLPEVENHSVFDVVAKSDIKLTCGNYQFKGWEIITKDVTRVNDDYFIMPEEDVVIRATWGKLVITKSMEGKMANVQTLYSVMADSAVADNIKSEFVSSDTGIDFSKISSDTNGKGVYQLSSTKDDEFPVYYYRGDVNNNNIKFANICWKAVRTTSTGGVKLIYSGVPNADGGCTEITAMGSNVFNRIGDSPAYNGYMYGTVYQGLLNNFFWYDILGKELETLEMFSQIKMSSSASYYYGDTITWDGTNYVLSNSDGSEVVKTQWQEKYNTLKGKYRCLNGTQTTCTELYYLAAVDNSNMYVLSLKNGQLLENVNTEWNLGKSITYENGRYTLGDTETINKVDWDDRYSDNYFLTCIDGSLSCEEVYYIIDKTATSMSLVKLSNGETIDSLNQQLNDTKFIYGNDVVWDGEKYTLTNTIESSISNWGYDRSNIGKGYHYTCFSTENSCSEVNYIYYTSGYPYYIVLKDGITIDKALEEMQTNTTDSYAKMTIDKWYSENMVDYTSYLEDTVWCNDRSMANSNGWTKDGNAMNTLQYGSYERVAITKKPDISCHNKNDAFTVSEENGNGALTYPAAMLTVDEAVLAGGQTTNNTTYYLKSNTAFMLLSPNTFYDKLGYVYYIFTNGRIYNNNTVNTTRSIRPTISLKDGIMIADGDGTVDSPYTVIMR